jgi:MFS family permease
MSIDATMDTAAAVRSRPMSREEKRVILASSLGTVFEWYDFYLYGALATVISAHFFSNVNETTGFIFALAAFAAGFAVRPFGALVFGRIGDIVGRKNTFLVTMAIMGLATFLVGLLPDYQQLGMAAPVLLIVLRLLQGLAIGGEYGGAAVYVAEHAPADRRALHTSWINAMATVGLLLSLLVIMMVRAPTGGLALPQPALGFAAHENRAVRGSRDDGREERVALPAVPAARGGPRTASTSSWRKERTAPIAASAPVSSG